jgi:glycosyltransferase involved in cell wall biosynthesis
MKILHVSNGGVPILSKTGGGTEKYILDLARCQAQLGNDVTVVDRKRGMGENEVQVLERIWFVRTPVPELKLKLGRVRLPLGLSYRLASVIDSLLFGMFVALRLDLDAFDVLHFHDVFVLLPVVILKRTARHRSVFTQHGVSFQLDTSLLWFYQTIRIFVIRRVAAVIALNPVARSQFEAETQGSCVLVRFIPAGVKPVEIHPLSFGNDLKDSRNLKEQIVLFVGRITNQKGVEVLIEAAEILIQQRGKKNLTFVIVGPNEQFDASVEQTLYSYKLSKMIKEFGLEGHIHLTGRISGEALERFFTICDIFVLPSYFETFPRVVLEAMSFGKPVIASRLPGTLMQIRNGYNGYLVRPGDIIDLADKIELLLDNPNLINTMGQNGFSTIKQRFDVSVVAREVLETYREVITRASDHVGNCRTIR